MRKNLKGTWSQAIANLFIPVLLVLGIRWAIAEPFVIPSGSMIPNLLIHDHILVKKFSLGLRVPFSKTWLIKWQQPQRGQIMVFHYPKNPDVYYIKRLVGLPGDRIILKDNRKLFVNDQEWQAEPIHQTNFDEGNFDYYLEKTHEGHEQIVRYLTGTQQLGGEDEFIVPEGQYFFMGDNRDQSSDSRYWGFVPESYLVGPAGVIWLSCEKTLPTLTYVCDPSQIRWSRIFKILN